MISPTRLPLEMGAHFSCRLKDRTMGGGGAFLAPRHDLHFLAEISFHILPALSCLAK